MKSYVHGYTQREAIRLEDQANALNDLLHYDSFWEDGSLILEAGCGTGAQTKIIADKNKGSRFLSVDISPSSIKQAQNTISDLGIHNVEFRVEDIFHLTFEEAVFDHVFICFVLEHLSDTLSALSEMKRVLKPGGTITVIEGDHGSAYFHPDSHESQRAIQCLIDLQLQKGGDANIGRRLYPLLNSAGFADVSVSPRMVYVDDSRPGLVKGFTLNTFTAMIEGVRKEALETGMIGAEEFDKGIRDLKRTASGGGTFCYMFFKAKGTREL